MGGELAEAWVTFQMVGPGGLVLLAIQGDSDDDYGCSGGSGDDWHRLNLVGRSCWQFMVIIQLV